MGVHDQKEELRRGVNVFSVREGSDSVELFRPENRYYRSVWVVDVISVSPKGRKPFFGPQKHLI